MKTSEAARKRNVSVKTTIKHIRRNILEMTEGEIQAGTAETYKQYCSALDKAVKHGTLKKNTAIRRKARVADRMRKAASKTVPVAETSTASVAE
jgi:ribosomal protein S20